MKLIAHRGIWNKYIKDNSYESIKRGLESDKYIGIECDIRQTRDKKFILYHNALYKGELIKNKYYSELKDISLLESILKINSNKLYLLEIKDFNMDINAFLKLLNKYKRNIYIMSFDINIIKRIRKITSDYKLGVLNYILNSEYNYDLDFICLLNVLASDKVLNYFKSKNIEVIIYGVKNVNKNLTYIIDDNKSMTK